MSEVVAAAQQGLAGKYKPYPEYKDSGVVWLGEMPSTWVLAKTARYFKIAMGQTILKEQLEDDGEWPVYSATEGDHYFGRVNDPQVRLGCGDLVIPARGNSIGFVKLVKEQVTTTQTTIYCKHLTQKIYPEYAYYFMVGQKKNLFWFTQTAIPQITVEEIGSNPILLPSFEEQRTIVAFLDYETARIDRLIAKQQRLIELLKEKRQAVISHAVTKGLNPNTPMKDSGVEWLGQVPEHWAVGRYKFCNSRIIVGIAEAATHAYVDHGVPLIRSTNIKESGLDCSDVLYLNPVFAAQNITKKLRARDIVTVRTGYPGISAVVPLEFDNSQCFTNLVATPLPQHESDFLCEYLNSAVGKSYFELNAWGSAQKNISVPILQDFPVAWPSQVEEVEIVSFCKKNNEKYNKLIDTATKGIELLQERRTALISAAVTGKIDLRGWTPPADEVAV
ncbi:restriction endonuclease subunit S [Aeromonas caviae]